MNRPETRKSWRRTPAAAAIALAIAGPALSLHASADPVPRTPSSSYPAVAMAQRVPAPAAIRAVSNCDDSGPGSLRAEVAAASSGDTIDLGGLACDTITLAAAIDIPLDELTFAGPTASMLVIDADQIDRAFAHSGVGTLTIERMSIIDGSVIGGSIAAGGCIYSAGSVALADVVVSGCHANGANAVGGAIAVAHSLELVRSTLSGNLAYANLGYARGGAAYVQAGLDMHDSVVDNNYVQTLPVAGDAAAVGGGLFLYGGDFRIVGSTISNNDADIAGGIEVHASAGGDENIIVNSTIAGNGASNRIGGIHVGRPLSMIHVTVAGNTAPQPAGTLGHGVGVQVDPNIALTVESTLIAGNNAGAVNLDLGGDSGICIGSHSLIPTSVIEVPADTITTNPQLQPLADNGGPTWTMALSPGSPAIDAATNPTDLPWDQRGDDYVRVVGPAADIGAFEYSDIIFADSFE